MCNNDGDGTKADAGSRKVVTNLDSILVVVVVLILLLLMLHGINGNAATKHCCCSSVTLAKMTKIDY